MSRCPLSPQSTKSIPALTVNPRGNYSRASGASLGPILSTHYAQLYKQTHLAESPIDEKFIHHDKFRLKFDLASIPKGEKLKAAEIKLTRESLPASGAAPIYRLLVHDILRRGVKGKRPPIMRVIDSQLIDTRENSTVSVDVSPAVQRWLQDPKTNYGVLVALHASGKAAATRRHLRLRRHADADWWQKQPVLYTYTDDGKNRQRTAAEMKLRPKRGAGARKIRQKEKDPCRRRKMYVDFRDVGYEIL